MEEYNLNDKQKMFADEYITNGGNATQAAITAGYSEKTAYSQGNRLLKHDEVRRYLKEMTEAIWDERQMTVSEALAISASIARGEPQEAYSKHYNHIKKEVTKEVTYTLTPDIEERQRSLEHIFKVSGAFLDKKEITGSTVVQFIDDIGSGLDGD